jgi:hypothetical protein
MPQNIEKLKQIKYNFGDILFEWDVPEFEERQRGMVWYLLMLTAATILMIISIVTANFLFALIIILTVFIVFLKTYSFNRNLKFRIFESGIMLGNEFFEYKDIKAFYLIYDPPFTKKLYLTVKSFGPDMSVPLDNINPLSLREALLDYLAEDLEKENETLEDQLDTFLKL